MLKLTNFTQYIAQVNSCVLNQKWTSEKTTRHTCVTHFIIIKSDYSWSKKSVFFIHKHMYLPVGLNHRMVIRFSKQIQEILIRILWESDADGHRIFPKRPHVISERDDSWSLSLWLLIQHNLHRDTWRHDADLHPFWPQIDGYHCCSIRTLN